MSDGKVCWMKSVTGRFGLAELYCLHFTIAPNLIEVLQGTDPIVVLRALVELLGHGHFDKLRAVGGDETVSLLWHNATPEDMHDREFMDRLKFFFNEVNPEPVG